MHPIEMQEMSRAFFGCWQAAGEHLDRQVDSGIRSWLRAHPYPPFLEHLSFRLGNQLFFVRVEDVDGNVEGPGSLRGLKSVARQANGHACVLPMRRSARGQDWIAEYPGWGLLDAESQRPIDPVAMITDERIAMTAWEEPGVAVQVVREYLQQEGFKLMSWQSDPDVDPSIWFVGRTGQPEWVVVRASRVADRQAPRPANWLEIAAGCSNLSSTGHFASVALASGEQAFESAAAQSMPLWRGHELAVVFCGLT